METYLVGGAVRDEMLGLSVRERDWVVVGARPDDLTALGYRLVGRDFPVFLHPETQEEYALARVERKTAPGYTGFAVRFSPDVTLEEDLQRRDLTINAMARDAQGNLFDPYGGQADLQQRLLRHVSGAFAEDPVRVLRVARFAARFAPLGFTIAPETQALLRHMVDSGEVSALVPERTWQETARALGEARPDVFFTTLRDCGALEIIFPELAKLWGVPQPVRWHPEIDTGVHIMMVLRVAAERTPSIRIRFAALTHDLGKGETAPERWPAHHGHEERSVHLVERLAARMRVPNDFRELALITARYHGLSHRALELRPSTLLELLEHLDAFRRPERFAEFLVACECDLRGRAGFEARRYPQAEFLQLALTTAATAALTAEDKTQFQGPALGERLREKRVALLTTLVNEQRASFIAAK